MRNSERYNTAEEFEKAFEKYCKSKNCVKCNLNGPTERVPCLLDWLELESEEEKPLPCPGCGNTDMHVHDEIQDSKVYIVCPNCGYSSPGEMKLESSVRRHNEIARAVMEAKKEGETR